MVSVKIYAVNSLDPYSRYWTIYKNGATVKRIVASSGYTWNTDLESGVYEFDVSQVGGATYGTYSGTINGVSFSGVDGFNSVQFTVGAPPPPPGPSGNVVAIRVQDIARQEWFNYDNGVWGKAPKVTVGANLYIAAYALNEGASGLMQLIIKDDAGAFLAVKQENIASGAYIGVETGTIEMPARQYGILITVAPSYMQQTILKFDPWGIPIRTSEAELYRRAVLGQKAQPWNIKIGIS